PVLMLEGPIHGTAAVLKRAGLELKSIDLFEVNEAFASVVLAWQKETGADLQRTNVNGGAVAVGHPLGASGAILMTRLLHELERRDGRYGLETMCCGGGLGTATIIDRVVEEDGPAAGRASSLRAAGRRGRAGHRGPAARAAGGGPRV